MATICFSLRPVTRRKLSFPNPPNSSRTLVQTIKPTMFFGHGKLCVCSINYAQCHQGVWSDTNFQALITFALYGGELSDSSLDQSSSMARALARPTAGLGTVVKGNRTTTLQPSIQYSPHALCFLIRYSYLKPGFPSVSGNKFHRHNIRELSTTQTASQNGTVYAANGWAAVIFRAGLKPT